jgi:excisionase family DNA binding protein
MVKKYMDVKDVAKYLGVSQATIYRWVTARQIPFIKMRGCLRFIDFQIDEWMLEQTRKSSGKLNHLKPQNIDA